jgi:hypothetical protein
MTVNKRDAAQGQGPESDGCQIGRDDVQSSADSKSTDIPPPLEAIRLHCLWCCIESALDVRLCPAMSCPLWPYRFGRNPTADMIAQLGDRPIYPLEDATTAAEFHENGGTRIDAIVRRCLDCSGCSKSEVRDCRHVTCDLHPFRSGKNPNRAASPEQREIKAARLKANIDCKRNRNVG